jgi:class 3 adenylate cyclase
MSKLKDFEFERSRGLVWVCDLANSSKYLNDNQSADELERFLPKLYWIASMAVDAAEGTFVKWTGDGFMAWFETPLHRMLGEQTARVFNAAWHLSFLVNTTQLGLSPKLEFKIRHGVTYEHDALLIKIKHTENYKSLDLIGRAVVLAFRLSGIPAEFPGIITQKELINESVKHSDIARDFVKWRASANDKLKYFKGERWGTGEIYVSSDKIRKAKSLKSNLRQTKKAIARAEGHEPGPNAELQFAKRFLANMETGPEWCREVTAQHTRFIRENMLSFLKTLVPVLEETSSL